MLNFIPLPYRIIGGLLLLAVVFALGWHKGSSHVQAQWDAAIIEQSLQVAQAQKKQADATVQVVTQYVDRIKVVRDKADTLIKEIPVYVTQDTCPLPAGFRVLHDAAARGEPAIPADVTDAQPVAAQDLAATIATNYRQYFELATQLEALQVWVRAQEVATHE